MADFSRVLLATLALMMISACTGAALFPTAESNNERTTDPTVTLRLAFPSTPDVDDVPALIAAERLAERGIIVETTFYAQSELATAATAQGDADIGFGSTVSWLSGVQEGAPIVGVMEQAANGWSVFAVRDIQSCAELDGRRTAIHSEGAISTALLRAYIAKECPGVEPDYLVIPGSENRAAALLAGEIDVTPVELTDAIRLDRLRPETYTRIADFAGDLPDLFTTGVWANRDQLAANPQAIQAFLAELLKIHGEIAADPMWFADQLNQKLEVADDEIAMLPIIVEAKMAINAYSIDGGLTEERARATLEFFIDAGRLDPALTFEEAFDMGVLEDARRQAASLDADAPEEAK